MKVKGYWVLIGFILCLITGGLIAVPKPGFAEENLDPLEKATEIIVMIEGELGGAPTYGAGIIFAQEQDALYIATANHVVRRGSQNAQNLRVKFKKNPNDFVSGQLLDKFDSDLDLAVISISGVTRKGIDLSDLDMKVLGKSEFSGRGDRVYPVGNPNGVPWGMPVVPDQIAQMVGKGITFQSAFITSGHSGGGLIEESGLLVGMIIKDQPPFGLAVTIDEVASTLAKWGIHFR